MRYLILILSVLFVFSCATIDSVEMDESVYIDGYLNISDIMSTWSPGPVVSSIGGMPMLGFINSDDSQSIQYVLVILYANMPIGYAYLLHGEVYAYFLDSETMEFCEIQNIDKEQWKLNFEVMFLLKST